MKDLHLLHMAPAPKGWRVDLDKLATIRIEGDLSAEEKRAIAYRVAFTWNMNERIPLEAIENGCVADFYEAALALANDPGSIELAEKVKTAWAAHKQDEREPECCKGKRGAA